MNKTKKIISPTYEIENIVSWIRDYFVRNGNTHTKAIIGISGGKDSTIAAALLVRALGPDRVVGVMMPQGFQPDGADALRVCNILGIQHYTINISAACEGLYDQLSDYIDEDKNIPLNIKINTPPRIRMATLYAVANMVEGGGRVCHTGNASEAYIGFTTKYGDLAGDFSLFGNYYVRDVVAIGLAMKELPEDLVLKAPSDGLTGRSDEESVGFTYEELDAYVLDGATPSYEVLRAIVTRHEASWHKGCVRLPNPVANSRRLETEEFDPNKRNKWSF